MGNNQYPPQPSLIREGATLFCHCERQNGASQSHNNCNMNKITTSNAPHSPRNDKESLCKTQVSGAAASCSLAFNGPTVDVCNGSTILPPSLCPQLARATLPRNDKFSSRFTLHASLKKTYRPNVLSSYRLKNKLASHFTLHPSLRRKVAFTLAEVLITLGIIGVVAAMTIPGYIEKTAKQVTVSKLKKSYSNLQQVIRLSEAENGEVSTWPFEYGSYDSNFVNSELFKKYFLPYIKVVGQYGLESPEKVYYQLYTIDGEISYAGSNAFIVFPDGTSIGTLLNYTGGGTNYLWIFIDINGKSGPNRLGKDVFMTELLRNNRLVMWGDSGTGDRDYLINDVRYSCKKGTGQKYAGGFCGALIQMDGWQIKDDYPW